MSASTALSAASVALCTFHLVEISVQTEGKLSTSMTQHAGMHQRMWLSPFSLLLSQFSSPPSLSLCGQVHMHPVIIKVIFSRGLNPCLWPWACVTGPWLSTHRTLTLYTTPEKISISAVVRSSSFAAFAPIWKLQKKPKKNNNSVAVSWPQVRKQ